MNAVQPMHEFADVRQAVVQREEKKFLSHQTKDLHFFSASLSRLLPHLPLSEHQEYYLDFMAYRSLAVLQSETSECLSCLLTEGDMEFMTSIRADPRIFCSFHLGSYRSLMGFMIKAGFDFALLVDKRTYSQQSETIYRACNDVKTGIGSKSDFYLVDAERPDALVTVLRHLEAGRSLVVYLDGNTGSGGIFSNNPSVYLDMEFLGQPFRSRKGLATLAYLAKKPIIPAISFFRDSAAETVLWFGPPIPPPVNRSAAFKDRYVETVTRQLYGMLEEKLRLYPLQWEPWLYVHKFLALPSVNNDEMSTVLVEGLQLSGRLSFNHNEFALFKIDLQAFLFSRKTYEPYPIDNEAFNILSIIAGQPAFDLHDCPLSRDSLVSLIKKGVFVHD